MRLSSWCASVVLRWCHQLTPYSAKAVWSIGRQSHLRAAAVVRKTVDEAFAIFAKTPVSEYAVQQLILQCFAAVVGGNHPPIVAINAHSADPHFEPTPDSGVIRPGDFVLIDLWAKEPDGVYADYTWTGFMGNEIPARYQEIFTLVRDARNAAITFVKEQVGKAQTFYGYEVDAAARNVISAGYGKYFVHRTGHSIGDEVHGNGANMDGLETRDERRVLPGTCFSIEPGIYLPGEFGVRSEVNVYVTEREAIVTGTPMQTELVRILA
jgi:Xaa-Pro aminopeptidase